MLKLKQTSITLLVMITAVMAVMCETSYAKAITSFSQLNDPAITIGTDGNTPLHYAALKEFPKAKYSYFWEASNGFLALKTGKIDAYVLSEMEALPAIRNGLKGVRILPGYLGEPVPIAAGISRKSKIKGIKEKFNAFIAESKANGTIDNILRRWVYEGDTRIPEDVKVPQKSDIHLTVGTTGTVMPFSYFIGNQISGADIEIAHRFAAYLGAELEFVVYNFSSAFTVGSSETVDMALSCMFATPKRAETMNFSDPIYNINTIVMVRDDEPVKPANDNSVNSFNGKNIAVITGSINDRIVEEALPSAKILSFENFSDAIAAVLTRKADAFAEDEEILRPVIRENDKLTFAEGYLKQFDYAPIFAKTEYGDKIRGEFNEFLKRIKSDGTLKQIEEIWLGEDDSKKVLPNYDDYPDTNGVIRIVVSNESPPFDYMSNGKMAGYEVDVILRFCKEKGYKPDFITGKFSSVMPSIASNKCDIGMTILTITPERAESVNFSDPIYTGGAKLLILKAPDDKANTHGKYKTLADLNGQPIGVQTGIPEWAKMVKELMPKSEIVYYNTFSDLMQALFTSKIEAFLADKPVYELMAAETGKLTAISEKIDEAFDVAFAFPKTEAGKKLCDEVSEYIRTIKANGELDKIISKWVSAGEDKKTLPDYKNFKAEKGVLTMATEGEYEPFNYIRNDNELAGFEIDIAARFCEAYGYGLDITPMAFDSILPAIVSGKFDFAGASLAPADEHTESALFSEPYYQSSSVLVVMKHDEALTKQSDQPETHKSGFAAFIEDIKASLNRTFIREDRWRLFVEGIVNTMIITVLSIIFGTILGFVIYLFCRSGNIFANVLTDFTIWLVKGTPIVVLLMILYYVVFGSVNISGIWVAVIAFTMTFGSSFCIMLRFGTGAVDRGQTEAAYSLGFTDWQTFFTVILPQAALHFITTYKVEVTNLIKSTSIVGYIAVQDLTKMGDIVRSRTYEAFFPLLAVAAIYFILAGILNIIVGIIQHRITPSKRKPEAILKGIKLTGGENHD